MCVMDGGTLRGNYNYIAYDNSCIGCEILNITVQMYPCSEGTGFFRNYPYHSPFAYISFAAKSALLHLPYIVRFTIFNLLFVPSTKPFESKRKILLRCP